MQRYYGWYASRTRGRRRQQELTVAGARGGHPGRRAGRLSLRAARARWAELLRRIFEVDPLTCPQCQGVMRVVAVITAPGVIARILAHRGRSSGADLPAAEPAAAPPPPHDPDGRRSPPPVGPGAGTRGVLTDPHAGAEDFAERPRRPVVSDRARPRRPLPFSLRRVLPSVPETTSAPGS